MAAHYLEPLREVQPQGPYQLAGWSFGGLVACEMARRLEAEGQEVALLALFETAAPEAGRDGRITLLRAASRDARERALRIGRGEEPDATVHAHEEPTLGWSRWASLPVEVHGVPGEHLTLLAPAHLGELAARLSRCLESVGKALPVLDCGA